MASWDHIDTIKFIGSLELVESSLRDLPFDPHSYSFSFHNPRSNVKRFPIAPTSSDGAAEYVPASLLPQDAPENLEGTFSFTRSEHKFPFLLSGYTSIKSGARFAADKYQPLDEAISRRDLSRLVVEDLVHPSSFRLFWETIRPALKIAGYDLTSGKVIFGEHTHVGDDEPMVAGQLYFKEIAGSSPDSRLYETQLNFTGMLAPHIKAAYASRFDSLVKEFGPRSTLL